MVANYSTVWKIAQFCCKKLPLKYSIESSTLLKRGKGTALLKCTAAKLCIQNSYRDSQAREVMNCKDRAGFDFLDEKIQLDLAENCEFKNSGNQETTGNYQKNWILERTQFFKYFIRV